MSEVVAAWLCVPCFGTLKMKSSRKRIITDNAQMPGLSTIQKVLLSQRPAVHSFQWQKPISPCGLVNTEFSTPRSRPQTLSLFWQAPAQFLLTLA